MAVKFEHAAVFDKPQHGIVLRLIYRGDVRTQIEIYENKYYYYRHLWWWA